MRKNDEGYKLLFTPDTQSKLQESPINLNANSKRKIVM